MILRLHLITAAVIACLTSLCFPSISQHRLGRVPIPAEVLKKPVELFVPAGGSIACLVLFCVLCLVSCVHICVILYLLFCLFANENLIE